MKMSKRNSNGKREEEIMANLLACAILKYGRYKKMLFCAFVGHERYKLLWNIFNVIVGVPPSSFVIVSFLLTSLRKDYFVLRRL